MNDKGREWGEILSEDWVEGGNKPFGIMKWAKYLVSLCVKKSLIAIRIFNGNHQNYI